MTVRSPIRLFRAVGGGRNAAPGALKEERTPAIRAPRRPARPDRRRGLRHSSGSLPFGSPLRRLLLRRRPLRSPVVSSSCLVGNSLRRLSPARTPPRLRPFAKRSGVRTAASRRGPTRRPPRRNPEGLPRAASHPLPFYPLPRREGKAPAQHKGFYSTAPSSRGPPSADGSRRPFSRLVLAVSNKNA